MIGVIKIIEWAGEDTFFYYCSVFGLSCVLFFMVIFPNFIAPLFNKFRLLNETGDNEREADLLQKITEVAAEVKFPVGEVYVIDGSKRSHHSNAYFFGVFGKKMVVLYDTLLTQMDNDDITAVICHEFGHWYYCHSLVNLVITLFNMTMMLGCSKFFLFDEGMYSSFGCTEKNLIIGFLLGSGLFVP